MTAKYQLLPNFFHDDLKRLTDSIREHGIRIPVVVDEDGEILDGHHRVKIADELGLGYPTIIMAGLSEHEKRILAVDLNISRRHLTDAQKVMVGMEIEPDIAAVAEARQKAMLKQGNKPREGQVVPSGKKGKTIDEVATAAGVGSGKTYERGKKVIEAIEQEEDAEQLMLHIENGDWTLKDARKELTRRQKQREAEKAQKIINLAGDSEGRIARARRLTAFSSIQAAIGNRFLPLNPVAVCAVLDEGDKEITRDFLKSLRAQVDAIEEELDKSDSIRLVPRNDA